MFPNVRAEMVKKKITLAMIVKNERVNCNISTLSQKLNGKYPLSFNEALGIKDALGSKLTLEELFETDLEAV